jgi:putative phosphoesterase
MRIAVLGDIHSNLVALEAVLAEVTRSSCDLVLHTGGVIGFGARPNETIDLLRVRGIEGVRGHFDEDVAWADTPTPKPGNGAPARGGSAGTLSWNVRTLGFTQRQFLKDLPFSLQKSAGEKRLLLFHASPVDLHQSLEEDTAESRLEELAEETGAEVHLFGHTHRPFHRFVGGAHFINAGSVGRPQDGDPRACVAIVEIERSVGVTFRRVDYDVEKTIQEIVAAGLPTDVTRALRLGR